MFKSILLAFIPLFVTVDALGTLPIFVSLTHHLSKQERQKILFQSILTALCLAISFIFLGKAIFKFIGVTIGDFMVAGGLVLMCIAIMDLLNPGMPRKLPAGEMGSVPIGTPLIVGPAVLTTSLLLIDVHGIPATLIAVTINVLLAGVVFSFSDALMKIFGQSGSRALSKVMALLLAAIAVMMIRKGVSQIFLGSV